MSFFSTKLITSTLKTIVIRTMEKKLIEIVTVKLLSFILRWVAQLTTNILDDGIVEDFITAMKTRPNTDKLGIG